MTLSTFLAALGLPRIGPEIASVIATEVGSLETLLELVKNKDEEAGTDADGKPNKYNSAIDRLIAIDRVGETVARLLLDGLDTRSAIVEELSLELDITEESPKQETGPLRGLTFCITGALSRPRKEVAIYIKISGGKVVSSVSGKLDYLVAGESAGSKLDKANRLGVKILSESELAEMIGMNAPFDPQSSLGDF
jgi:DNA ligase (NAD+)